MDLQKIFEYGQAYVALSRVQSSEGLRITPFRAGAIRSHPRVVEYYRNFDNFHGTFSPQKNIPAPVQSTGLSSSSSTDYGNNPSGRHRGSPARLERNDSLLRVLLEQKKRQRDGESQDSGKFQSYVPFYLSSCTEDNPEAKPKKRKLFDDLEKKSKEGEDTKLSALQKAREFASTSGF